MTLKILFIGDIVGKIARRALHKELPKIIKKAKPDIVIANGENATHGHGITRSSYQEIRDAGVDCITLGDHVFDRKETPMLLDTENTRIIRPANYPPHSPGEGQAIIEVGSKKILVINLLGRVFMRGHYDDPFRKIDEILAYHKNKGLNAILVDFHAEATSEKNAFGWYVDGRVSAVLGTHTHVPTADAKILPNGTAYLSDVGMVGGRDSIIGAQKERIIQRFQNQFPGVSEPTEDGPCQFNSVLLEIDPKSQKCVSIKRLDKEIEV